MDRRILKTKNAIKTSYRNLLMKKSNSKITITELAEHANIDRKTFYLHYDSIDSIAHEIMEENLLELKEVLEANGFSENSFDAEIIIHAMNTCIEKDIDFFTTIVHHSDFDFFVKKMKDIFFTFTFQNIEKNSDIDINKFLIYTKFTLSGVTDLYADWFRGNINMTLNELGIVVSKIINEGINVLK